MVAAAQLSFQQGQLWLLLLVLLLGLFLSAAIPETASDRDSIVANNRAHSFLMVASLGYVISG